MDKKKKNDGSLYTKSSSKTPNSLTVTHAVRGRLTLKEGNKRHFRTESTYRDLVSKNDIQMYSMKTQKYSNTYQTKSNDAHMNSYETRSMGKTSLQGKKNTNSSVYSYEPLDYAKPIRSFNSKYLSLFLTLSVLYLFMSICYSLKSFLLPLICMIFLVSIVSLLCFVMQLNNLHACLANECFLFENVEDLITREYVADIIDGSRLRSRYAKFVLKQANLTGERFHKLRVAVARDREPSRIPVKKLTRIMNITAEYYAGKYVNILLRMFPEHPKFIVT